MPSKTAKGASNKTHNRATSTSSTGKLNLNVAFTRNKSADKIKRNSSDIQHHLARNTTPYPHQNHIRSQTSPTKRPVVLQVDTGGDDDEWVSSESGAVTPADYDEEDAAPPALDALPLQEDPASDSDPDPVPSTTPRADPAPLPPLPPHRPRPRPQSLVDLPRVNTVTKFTTHADDSPSPDSLTQHHPPTPTHRAAPRRAVTRPPSMRSVQSARPHPLIRARSYAPSTPIATAPPGLTEVHAAPAGSSGPSPLSSPNKDSGTTHGSSAGISGITHGSSTGISGTTHGHSPSSEHHYSHYYPRLKRQTSHSSVTSVATLPLPTTSSAATASTTRVHGERQRTLSHAPTSAALSSLTAATHPHPPSRAASPVLTIAFPPINPRSEHVHIMIPPPLVPPHVSATAHQNPILEALQRVSDAKARAGR